MRFFRLRRKPESGEEEKELVLDTDAEPQAPAHNTPDAEEKVPESAPEADAPTQGEAPAPEGDLLAQIGAEAEGGSPQGDDSLDPDLLDVFRAAKNEVQESTLASELEDIPAQDLLSDLVGVSHRLHAMPRARDLAAEPGGSGSPRPVEPSPTGYRRYALRGLTLGLALTAAIGGLTGAGRLGRTEPLQDSPAQSQAGYPKSPVVVATVPAVAVTPENRAEPGPEPTREATPEPTPELQPAYFLYTVQPGDTVSTIAGVFGISRDYILWNNPDIIKDPNVLLVGEELLIPSVDGIIYRVKPGDTLSAIAAVYQIDVQSILAFVPNGLTSPDNAIEGMVLILPKAVPPPPTGAATSPTATATPAAPTPIP